MKVKRSMFGYNFCRRSDPDNDDVHGLPHGKPQRTQRGPRDHPPMTITGTPQTAPVPPDPPVAPPVPKQRAPGEPLIPGKGQILVRGKRSRRPAK